MKKWFFYIKDDKTLKEIAQNSCPIASSGQSQIR